MDYEECQGMVRGLMSHIHIHEGEHVNDNEHSHNHDGSHVHSEEHKKKVVNRIAKAIGHLEAVKRMVERDVDCSEILIQLAAVRAEINNTGKVVLKDHLAHCIVEAIEEGDQETMEQLNKAIDMFVK